MNDLKCCIVTCDKPLDQAYWDNQYIAHSTGWDLGQVAPPIQSYINQYPNKEARVLIPGCGNTYEAEYLLAQGFQNITVIDIAPSLVQTLKEKFQDNPNISVVLGDFFEHQGQYDLIIEQTFFCALPPQMRERYVWKMHQLLAENGKLAGLLFNREFEAGPPFGGNQESYKLLFQKAFVLNVMEVSHDSVAARADAELRFEFQKNPELQVNLYTFEGITCQGCSSTVTSKFQEIQGVENVSMSSDFATVLIVSSPEIALEVLQQIVSYDAKYKIVKI
ncbi:methyltransferase domain-containing protein [Flavobacterium sp. CYK-4]|uniref:methyltransferase domain-containing protein n=1 Tax=Flavobacterium lotistagni TaxID=2709660 RepID=UPI001408E2BE|nr:methyltransferase domain-containing protein [Flavobacterium lotistagni]NHM07583.1 methyltransferase domain-containing protein [Flavobacterium lotistagni]